MDFFSSVENMMNNSSVLSYKSSANLNDGFAVRGIDISQVIKLSPNENDSLIVSSDGKLVRVVHNSESNDFAMYSNVPFEIKDGLITFQ